MKPQEKKFRHFLIENDLRVSDFMDLIRSAGVVIGDKSAMSVLRGNIGAVKNRKGAVYYFHDLMRYAHAGLEKKSKEETPKLGVRICRIEKQDDIITGIIPIVSVTPIVDALKQGNRRLYTVVTKSGVNVLYCGMVD